MAKSASSHLILNYQRLHKKTKISYFDIQSGAVNTKMRKIKKGDAFIWHPELPHGGGPITTPGKTRKSIVFHCIPKTKSVYGVDEFFGHKPYDGRTHSLKSMNKLKRINSWNHFLKKIFKKKKNSEILNSGRFMIDHGEPKFDVNF